MFLNLLLRKEVRRLGVQGFNGSNNNDPLLYKKMDEFDLGRSRAITGTILIIGGLVLFIFMFSMVTRSGSGFGGFILFLAFLAAGAGAVLICTATMNFKKNYKELFVKRKLVENFANVQYDWKSGFYEHAVKSFGLCMMGNRFHSEDYLRATFDGIPFESADVTVQMVVSTGKSTHTITYFRGRMLVFDFPEKFVSSVQMFTDAFRYRGKAQGYARPEKVEMEGVEFNNRFDVFALNPHDAFYLLTPHFMEDMMALTTRYRNMAISIVGNKAFVGLNEQFHNAFDPQSVFSKINYPEEMQKVQNDINDIKNIIVMIRGLYANANPGYANNINVNNNNYAAANSGNRVNLNNMNNLNNLAAVSSGVIDSIENAERNDNYNADDYYKVV